MLESNKKTSYQIITKAEKPCGCTHTHTHTHTHTFSLNQYKKIITGVVCKIEYNVNKKVGLLNLSRSIFGV